MAKKTLVKRILVLSGITFLLILTNIAGGLTAGANNVISQENFDFSQGLKYWRTQINNKTDHKVIVKNNVLSLFRNKDVKSYFRVFRDIPVKPNTSYILSLDVRVSEGKNVNVRDWAKLGKAQVSLMLKAEEWLDEQVSRAQFLLKTGKKIPFKLKGDWERAKIVVKTPNNVNLIRINLNLQGVDCQAEFKNITFKEFEDKQKTINIIKSDPRIDGKLDDDVWANATIIDDFRVLGNPDKKAEVQTKVLLAINKNKLFVAFENAEPNIKQIKADVTSNSILISNDDNVEIFFTLDKVTFLQILVNSKGYNFLRSSIPRGYRKELFETADKANFFESISEVATYIDTKNKKWSVELSVDLTKLLPAKQLVDKNLIYANFARHRTTSKERYICWAPISGKRFASLEEFQTLKFKKDYFKTLLASDPQKKIEKEHTITKRYFIPEILTIGTPIKIIRKNNEYLQLKEKISIKQIGFNIDKNIKNIIETVLPGNAPGENMVIISKANLELNKYDLTDEQYKFMDTSAEAFILDIGEQIAITAETDAGLNRGIATLIMLINRIRLTKNQNIPKLTIIDAPRLKVRGICFTAGRLSKEEIITRITLMYLLRLNTIHLLLDINTFPFKMLNNKTKISLAEWQEIFNYAKNINMEMIPLWFAWGRQGALWDRFKEYRSIFVKPNTAITRRNCTYFKNIDPANPKAHEVVFALQSELIDNLKINKLNIGFDETYYDYMVSEIGRKKGWKSSDFVIHALNANYQFLKSKGVEMQLWGDMLDPMQNAKNLDIWGQALFDKLPKDITILDWKYEGGFDEAKRYPSLKMFEEAGFKTVIGASWYNPNNIKNMIAEVYKYGLAGHLSTTWNNTGFNEISSKIVKSIALAAHFSWSADNTDFNTVNYYPDFSVKLGTFYLNKDVEYAKNLTYIKLKDNSVKRGFNLMSALKAPSTFNFSFLTEKMKNFRGVDFKVNHINGNVGAIIVPGDNLTQKILNGNFNQNMSSWRVQNANSSSLKAEVVNKRLILTRNNDDTYFRVYQDVVLDDSTGYKLQYDAFVQGTGNGTVSVHILQGKQKETLRSRIHAKLNKKYTIKIPKGTKRIRISVSVHGKEITGSFDNFSLKPLSVASRSIAKKINPKIKINSTAKNITFLHTMNKLFIDKLRFKDFVTRFRNLKIGEYIIHYVDNTKITIPLLFDNNITDWNSQNIGIHQNTGIFVELNNNIYVSLPTFTWQNPHVNKTIKYIEIKGGTNPENNLVVFGITLDN